MPPTDDNNNNTQSLTQGLLRRAHSPSTANRIFADKIQHRPLFLRPSTPPPPPSSTASARNARRDARSDKKKEKNADKRRRPKPLSARERRRRQLYRLPAEGRRYAVFAPLRALWAGYAREILGAELYGGSGQGAAARLSAADFHGAEVEVARSRCPSRVGVRGVVVKDTRFTFEVVTPGDKVKTLPKEGTVFRVRVPVPDPAPPGDHDPAAATADCRQPFCFEIHGDQFQHRASDRANKKFKHHFLKDL